LYKKLLPFFSLPAFFRQGRAGIKKKAKLLLFEKIGYSIILPQKNKKIKKKNTRLRRRVNPKVFASFFPCLLRAERKKEAITTRRHLQ
jgi:hypothetical protein